MRSIAQFVVNYRNKSGLLPEGWAGVAKTRHHCRLYMILAATGLLLSSSFLASCGPLVKNENANAAQPHVNQKVVKKIAVARNQIQYVFLEELNLPNSTGTVTLSASNAKSWVGSSWDLYEVQKNEQPVTGVNVDQVLGKTGTQTDTGSLLIPCASEKADAGQKKFKVQHADRLVLRVSIEPTMPAGVAAMQLRLQTANGDMARDIQFDVQDISLPTEPAVLAISTVSTSALTGMYPELLNQVPVPFLDRTDPEHRGAVEKIDALVAAAHREGVALFLEDLAPAVKLDVTGKVSLDWDAYDRTIQPYMTGEAFADHQPLQAWLVPLPPRRVRDTPAQLRQYWQACVEHAQLKGWQGAPVLYHPALMSRDADGALRQTVLNVLSQIDFGVAVATHADIRLKRPQLWVTDSADMRFPPAGALADAQSVRVWPWLAQARHLRGFIWQGAASLAGNNSVSAEGTLPLLADLGAGRGVTPTLRMAWLKSGLNDVALNDLMLRRAPEVIGYEVMAGVVGRTGAPDILNDAPAEPKFTSTAPYLFAGWATDQEFWDRLPAMIDKLIMAYDPGQVHAVSPDDPLYLKTKMWLAQAHRPAARVTHYDFSVAKGALGPLLMVAATVRIDNPISVESPLDFRWPTPPGNLRIEPRQATLPALGIAESQIRMVGHVDSLRDVMAPTTLQIVERNGGAVLDLPVLIPAIKIRSVPEPLRLDGTAEKWPASPADAPDMRVATRYANRADLLAGRLSREETPAIAQWLYDADWVYVHIDAPQKNLTDDRTSNWAMTDGRWWGSDALQVQIAPGVSLKTATRIIQIAVKPSGTVLQRAATLGEDGKLSWGDAPAGLRYAIKPQRNGYGVDLAIPRKWFGNLEYDRDPATPCWRVNVLRHCAESFVSTSWSGPIVDDQDVGMMGLLIGIGKGE